MRNRSTVSRPVLPRRIIVALLAAVAGFVLAPCATALADTYTANNFASPAFTAGKSVNGQNGWTSGPPCMPLNADCYANGNTTTGEFDQGIVATSSFYPAALPAGFGPQAFRISNGYASGDFAVQTFSSQVTPAGEPPLTESEFIATFSFITAKPTYQAGLIMSISPGNGTGGRSSWIGLTDQPAGTKGCASAAGCTLVRLADSPYPDDPGNFVYYPIAMLPDGVPHTITLQLKFNPGLDNDVAGISYDGINSGQCFTTWENYLRANPDGATGGVLVPTNSLQFRVSTPAGGVVPSLLGYGFLFGNVSITSGNGPGPATPACDVDITKDPDSPTVTAGGLAGFRITARNHSPVAAKNLLLCDRIPRETTFVTASPKLRRVGAKRCLPIARLAPGKSTSFHITLRVSPHAAAGTLDNTADVTPVPPANVPSTPPAATEDTPPGATVSPVIPPLKKIVAAVKVVARKAVVPAPPPVTG